MSLLVDDNKSSEEKRFIINDQPQVIDWNEAAMEITNSSLANAAGQPCFMILMGSHGEARLICNQHCQMIELSLSTEPVSNQDRDLPAQAPDRSNIPMRIFTHQLNGESDQEIIILFSGDIKKEQQLESFIHSLSAAAEQSPSDQSPADLNPTVQDDSLTQRELEILTLMAEGYGTNDMSQMLSISKNTLRNHIQHILQKLQAHSRLEAVAYALKHNLLE